MAWYIIWASQVALVVKKKKKKKKKKTNKQKNYLPVQEM